MLNYEIELIQKQLEVGAKYWHPDNEISYSLTLRYRELDNLKQKQL